MKVSVARAVPPIAHIRTREVETFNEAIWDAAWLEVVARTAASFGDVVAPHLAASVTLPS
jgi:hypothetical protein